MIIAATDQLKVSPLSLHALHVFLLSSINVQFASSEVEPASQLRSLGGEGGRPLAALGSVVMTTVTPNLWLALVIGRVAQRRQQAKQNATKWNVRRLVSDFVSAWRRHFAFTEPRGHGGCATGPWKDPGGAYDRFPLSLCTFSLLVTATGARGELYLRTDPAWQRLTFFWDT